MTDAAPIIPPRLLNAEQSAAYCGMSVASFDKEVAAGTLPGPVPLRRVRLRLWDRVALDRALDRALPVEIMDGGLSGGRDERKKDWQQRPGRPQAAV